MRVLVLAAIVTGCAVGTAAVSSAVLPDITEISPGDRQVQESWGRLRAAVYARSEAVAADLADIAPPPPRETSAAAPDPSAAPADQRATYATGEGVARWRVAEAPAPRPTARAIDGVSLADMVRTPEGPPPAPEGETAREEVAPITYARHGARSASGGDYDLAAAPRADVGLSRPDQTQAGAVLRLTRRPDRWIDRLGAGVRFGDRGRWYLFGAASGRAVGLNMLHDRDRGWTQGGISADAASALVSDFQAGVGWRKGSVQASLAWLKRKVKGAQTLLGLDIRDDTAVALTLSIKSRS